MTLVQIATPSDRVEMISFLHVMHAENGVVPLDEGKMVQNLDRGLARQHALIGVIKCEGKIAASVGLFLAQFWYSTVYHAEDFWNFVLEDYRKTAYAKELLTFAKYAADALEMNLLMGVLSTKRTEAKIRLYEKQLPFAGAAFWYKGEIKPAEVGG